MLEWKRFFFPVESGGEGETASDSAPADDGAAPDASVDSADDPNPYQSMIDSFNGTDQTEEPEPTEEKSEATEKTVATAPETPPLTDQERHYMAQFGLADDLKDNPAAARKVLGTIASLAQSMQFQKPAEAKPAEKKTEPTDAEILAQLGLEPDAIDKDMEKLLINQTRMQLKARDELQGRLDEVSKKFDEISGSVAQREIQSKIREFDNLVDGLGETWHGTFGKQAGESQQAHDNRARLWKEFVETRERKPELSASDALKRAVRAEFGEQAATVARKEVERKIEERNKTTYVRGLPTSRKIDPRATPAEHRAEAVREVEAVLKRGH